MAGTDYKLRIKGQDQTGKAFGKVNKNINSTQSAMKKLAGAFAGAFAVRQLVQFGNEALQIADAIGKTADATGVGVEFLQRYQFAAQQAGVETEKFNKALKFFTKGVGEATQGKGLAKEAFEDLGISIFNVGGKTKKSEELFLEFFTALEKVQDPMRRNALLAETFGAKVGLDMANMIKDGVASMEELAASATGVLDEETIRRAERFNDTMNILKRQILVPIQTMFINAADSVLMFLDAIGLIEVPKTMEELNAELDDLNKKQEIFNNLLEKQKTRSSFEDQTEKIALIKEEITQLEKNLELRKKIDQSIQDNTSAMNAMGNIASTLNSSFEEFFDFTKQGFLDFENMSKKILASIINEMVKIFIIKEALGFAAGSFGKDTKIGKVFQRAADKYEGGGFTGSGARAGGMDGRGGFMAMLHPNETVIDHTKGQGMGTTVNFNINTVDATGFDQLLVSRKGTITQIINNAMNNQGKMGVV
nr:Phage-related minor tail protein [uncultured Mediterranean phage uvMED]